MDTDDLAPDASGHARRGRTRLRGRSRAAVRLEVFPVERTDRDWLLGMYERCAQVWVSEDSVSMVYEAITSGARVGLLRVARTGAGGRVTRGLDDAARAGWATWFEEWSAGGVLPEPRGALDEASRVAGIVMERFGLAVGGGRG